MLRFIYLLLLACVFAPLYGQDSLTFGGVYELPGAEVRAEYKPVSPLAQRFTIEEVYRLPGTFYDPARLVALLPGVVQTNDQANHLSVRGNSPNKNLWRLNGLAIVNPNHTANAGTFYDFPTLNGGGVNAISAQMLDNSGFYSGGLPVEYGNATGGTFDLRLRPGSKTRHKQQFQAGFIGFDGTAEGPLGNSQKLSYLVNGRYSFTGLLADAGVDFGGEEIRFADVNLHLHYNADWGYISAFVVTGGSSNEFFGPEADGEEIEDQKDLFTIDFSGNLAIVGVTGQYNLPRSTIKLGAGYSSTPETRRYQTFLDQGDILSRVSLDLGRTSGFVKWERSLDDVWSVQLGGEFLNNSAGAGSFFNPRSGIGTQSNGVGVNINTYSPYVGFRMDAAPLAVNWGIRQSFYRSDFNQNASIFEPRVDITYQLGKGTFVLAAETTSQAPINAQLITGLNSDVSLPAAYSNTQISLAYSRRLGKVTVRGTVYAQRSTDEPAANIDGFLYGNNNLLEIDPFLNFDTVADSRRQGVELEIGGGDKARGWYYRGSVNVFGASTQQESGEWSEGRFHTNFVSKLTLGREWGSVDRKERARVYGLNLALIARGGERYGRIVEAQNSNIEILSYFAQPDYSTGFSNQLNTYFRPDLRFYKTKTRPKTTTTLALDIQNAAGIQNVGNVYYDEFLGRPNERFQLGLIPVLSYRILWR